MNVQTGVGGADLGKGVEELLARAFAPLAVDGGLGRRRHRPVAGEAAEVVDPGLVVHVERAAQALRPPPEAVLLLSLPRRTRGHDVKAERCLSRCTPTSDPHAAETQDGWSPEPVNLRPGMVSVSKAVNGKTIRGP